MAQPRNFAAEYAARIARGLARGFTRQEARRGRAPEHPGRPVPPERQRLAPPRPPATEQLGNVRRGEGLRTKRQADRALNEMTRLDASRHVHIIVRQRSGGYITLTSPRGWSQERLRQAMREEGGWQRLLRSLQESRYPGASRANPIDYQSAQLVAY
jgi:hypothetical protein